MPAPPFFFSSIATPDSFHRRNATASIWLVITQEFEFALVVWVFIYYYFTIHTARLLLQFFVQLSV